MDRRSFLRRIGLTGAAVFGAGAGAVALHDPQDGAAYFHPRGPSVGCLPSYRVPLPGGAVQLAVARGTDPARLVAAALGMLGGIERFVSPRDVVLLKPNVAFDRPAALGATTRPETLLALALQCRQAGAAQVLVADNPINQPEGCFYKTGIQAAAAAAGARLVLPRPNAFADVRIDGEVLSCWPLFEAPLRRADKVIGIAPCKDHSLCSASMSIKNWYGLLGGRRNQLHQHIHSAVADLALMIQPTLVVLDGTRLLMRNGPTGGSLGDVAAGDTLIAGTDMVAVDAVGYGLLGRDPARLEYLQRAAARGLGSAQWQNLNWRQESVG
jgi:uncharacterized protein (DUF362 family)